MSFEPLALATYGLSKTYRITKTKEGAPTRLIDALATRARHPFSRPPKESFRALTDVSLEVRQGEAVGIIGRNGAGKSTLLKVVSRIVVPTSGIVELYGRVGSLLEVGTGFHPELTGRENIFLNGAILGMSRREIVQKFDSIVEFAQVDRFLDTPVKRYSSGMYVRLAFSVAAHLNPDILVVDEVLAVGDQQFQKKCLGKMGDVTSKEGRTVLFVSHNMTAVESLCKRCVYLKDGHVVHDGPTAETIERYLSSGSEGAREGVGNFELGRGASADAMSPGILRRVELRDENGRSTDSIRMGEGLSLWIDVDGLRFPTHDIQVQILSSTEMPLVTINTRMNPPEVYDFTAKQERVLLTIPSLPLVHGHYWVSLFVLDRRTVVESVDRAASFEVRPADVYGGGYQMAATGRWAGVMFVENRWEVHSAGTVLAATPSGRT